MQQLYANLTREQVDNYELVLAASGLTDFEVRRAPDGWSIWVAETAYDASRQSIETYRRENPGQISNAAPETLLVEKTFSAIWVSLMLVSAFWAAGRGESFDTMADLCGASADKILGGELYRAATALMLHTTPAHLAGNIVGLILFGTAVCTVTGPGTGWLIILVTGIAGNLANAFLYTSGHLSVGASTAVFGALGFLSAWQAQRKMKIPEERIKAWLPFAGGVALLGVLGSSEFTDITAHLFGFAAGVPIGIGYARYTKSPLSSPNQVLCLILAVCLLAGSWIWAYFS